MSESDQEPFDVYAYLRCDCAEVGQQTCDKCVLRDYINSLRAALTQASLELNEAAAILEHVVGPSTSRLFIAASKAAVAALSRAQASEQSGG